MMFLDQKGMDMTIKKIKCASRKFVSSKKL